MIDAVLSYHMNPATCGVAKFNQQLAARLHVPFAQIGDGGGYLHPLVSIKHSESDAEVIVRGPFSLFLHEWYDSALVHGAETVYAANAAIAREARRCGRADVIEAWCPATVSGDPTRGAYRVLVFGMSHKLLLQHFVQLKRQLDTEHPHYTIELSTAVHEGSPWDEALTDSVQAMRAIFGDKLRVLGFLGDDALAKELRDVDAVAAYYTPALRANNTSAWAALEAGKTLYTNTDEYSPALDVQKYSWDGLLQLLGAHVSV